MRVIIQRVKRASVKVSDEVIGAIKNGLLILVGVTHDDDLSDVEFLAKKVVNLRIFEDEYGKMNKSIIDYGYEILSISQFTLFANTTKGNRPSFVDAASPEYASKLYESFNEKLTNFNINVETGLFGNTMEVELINDGPVTIYIDSKKR